jgi:hypothetical protein
MTGTDEATFCTMWEPRPVDDTCKKGGSGVLSALWGAIVAWDWQTYGPIVTALAAGLTALATIAYTVGALLLWGTTRRSVRALENAVKLTFLQTLYDAKRPVERPTNLVRNPSGLILYGAERGYQQEYQAALRQAFPQLYRSVHKEERAAAPEERQEAP